MCVCIVCCSRVQVEVDMKLDVQYCNETKESCLTSVDEVSGCMPSSHTSPPQSRTTHITPSPLTSHPRHSQYILTTHITPHHSSHYHHSQYILTTHITPSPLTVHPQHSHHTLTTHHITTTHNAPSPLTPRPHHSHHALTTHITHQHILPPPPHSAASLCSAPSERTVSVVGCQCHLEPVPADWIHPCWLQGSQCKT